AALVEEILQDFVGLQLDRVGLVHLPPELLVALQAGGEAGLGEAGARGHDLAASAGVRQEARGKASGGLALDSERDELQEKMKRGVGRGPGRGERDARRG